MKRSLQDLGAHVRDQVDQSGRSDDALREARSRFQMSLRSAGAPQGWLSTQRRWLFPLAFVTVIGAGVFAVTAFMPGTSNSPLQVALESSEDALVGTWVEAEEETKQLSFSDGTSLSIHPHTELRVRETTPKGATIELGRGRTLAEIEPLDGAEWKFIAGPFLVRVTGTQFDLSWDPEKKVLELALHQGSVVLSGPTLSGEQPVRKGQFVRVEVPQKGATAALKEGEAGTDLTAESGADSAPADSSKAADAPLRGKDAVRWQDSVRSGTPGEAVKAVERAGSKQVLATAESEQLWTLASKARLGGRPTLARDALLALRERHGTRGQTAYLLGKVHADQLSATSQAITWFETYLKEAPSGSLAEQAMGRLVELQSGTPAGRSAAKRYLNQYPKGSFAEYCRSQLL